MVIIKCFFFILSILYLADEVNDLLLCLVAGEPLVNVGDDVHANLAGQLVPDQHESHDMSSQLLKH